MINSIPLHAFAVHLPVALVWIMVALLLAQRSRWWGDFGAGKIGTRAQIAAASAIAISVVAAWYTGTVREPALAEALSGNTVAMRAWQSHRDFAKIYGLACLALPVWVWAIGRSKYAKLNLLGWVLVAILSLPTGDTGGALLYEHGSAVGNHSSR